MRVFGYAGDDAVLLRLAPHRVAAEAMNLAPELSRQLSRMEEARRQIQRQLDLIDRQITRRMTAQIPGLLPRRCVYRRGRAPDPAAFLATYRALLAALTAERQPEIDALSRKLARQEQAIASFVECHGKP